jgi:hypothetical protein
MSRRLRLCEGPARQRRTVIEGNVYVLVAVRGFAKGCSPLDVPLLAKGNTRSYQTLAFPRLNAEGLVPGAAIERKTVPNAGTFSPATIR